MRKLLLYIYVMVLLVSFDSCREPFDDSQIETNQNVLVVEGMITNEREPYHIYLSQALPFNSGKPAEVTKALVYIKDNTGAIYSFKETNKGDYISDSSSFVGILGRTYTLYITTPDGLEFKSTPCTITPNEVNIDTLYGFNEKYLVAQGTENLLDKFETAFHLYVDVSYNPLKKMNTRFEVILASPFTVSEMHYIVGEKWEITKIYDENQEVIGVNRRIIGTGVVDSFQTSYNSFSVNKANSLPVIKTNTNYSAGSTIQKIPLAYIYPEANSSSLGSGSSISYSSNWVVQLRSYSISDETFDYYYKIVKQLEGKNTLFEPSPVQLNGNIRCTTDTTRAVFGLFEANAVATKFIGVTYGVGVKYKADTASGWPIISSNDTMRFEIPETDTTVFTLKKKY